MRADIRFQRPAAYAAGFFFVHDHPLSLHILHQLSVVWVLHVCGVKGCLSAVQGIAGGFVS